MNAKSTAAIVVAAAALLAGCGTESSPESVSPVTLKQVADDLTQVTLTDQAVQRLGVVTAPVTVTPAGLRMPYAGVVYEGDGSTWVYTQVAKNAYLRAPITVRSIAGNVALLSQGPPVGTQVVVVGAPELLGAEVEISGEE